MIFVQSLRFGEPESLFVPFSVGRRARRPPLGRFTEGHKVQTHRADVSGAIRKKVKSGNSRRPFMVLSEPLEHGLILK